MLFQKSKSETQTLAQHHDTQEKGVVVCLQVYPHLVLVATPWICIFDSYPKEPSTNPKYAHLI